MSPEVFVEILKEALNMVILLVSAIILPSLFVGLIVAVFPGCHLDQRTNHEFSTAIDCYLAGPELGRALVGAKAHGFHFYHGRTHSGGCGLSGSRC